MILRCRIQPTVVRWVALWMLVPSVIHAEGASKESLRQSDKNWAAHASEAQVQRSARYFVAGDLEAAIQALRQACKLTPDSARVHFMLGNAYARNGEFESAAGAYRSAERLRPDHPDTPLNLGFALYRAGKPIEAREAWREAVRQSKRDPLARVGLAVGELASGDQDMALYHFSIAVYLNEKCATSEYYVKDFRWGEQGRTDVARLIEFMRREGW